MFFIELWQIEKFFMESKLANDGCVETLSQTKLFLLSYNKV